MPVDTHVHRVARRLGIIGEKVTADQAHPLLTELAGADDAERCTPCTWISCGTAAASATPGGRPAASARSRPCARRPGSSSARRPPRPPRPPQPPLWRTCSPGPRPCPTSRRGGGSSTRAGRVAPRERESEQDDVLPHRQLAELEQGAAQGQGEHAGDEGQQQHHDARDAPVAAHHCAAAPPARVGHDQQEQREWP